MTSICSSIMCIIFEVLPYNWYLSVKKTEFILLMANKFYLNIFFLQICLTMYMASYYTYYKSHLVLEHMCTLEFYFFSWQLPEEREKQCLNVLYSSLSLCEFALTLRLPAKIMEEQQFKQLLFCITHITWSECSRERNT
jgi:hypothetical protein